MEDNVKQINPAEHASHGPRAAISTVDAASYLGVSYSWLTKLRIFGGGPNFLKLGSRVLYRHIELDEWATTHLRQSTSDDGRVMKAR